jgi:hypothetical protein
MPDENLGIAAVGFPAPKGRLPAGGHADQFAWVDSQSSSELSQDSNTRRNRSAFYRAEVTGAQSRSISQLLLRELSRMASTPHIYRHGLLEVHGQMASMAGTIFPGTIVPIQLEIWCISSDI